MFESIGSKVLNLKRTRVGRLALEGLKRGKYRTLTIEEIRYLKEL
jgi:23S rRNA pseudouridine2605 synthase